MTMKENNGKAVYTDGRVQVLEYGITEIDKSTFEDIENLVSVVLPGSIEKIKHTPFFGCKKLESVVLPPINDAVEHMAFYRSRKRIVYRMRSF